MTDPPQSSGNQSAGDRGGKAKRALLSAVVAGALLEALLSAALVWLETHNKVAQYGSPWLWAAIAAAGGVIWGVMIGAAVGGFVSATRAGVVTSRAFGLLLVLLLVIAVGLLVIRGAASESPWLMVVLGHGITGTATGMIACRVMGRD